VVGRSDGRMGPDDRRRAAPAMRGRSNERHRRELHGSLRRQRAMDEGCRGRGEARERQLEQARTQAALFYHVQWIFWNQDG
jgi:hypothetical protein